MNLSPVKRIGLACVGMLLMTVGAHADQADDIYKHVKDHINSMKDYSLQYDYHGPRGDYKFDYKVVRPSDVRTQILAGSNSGAVILYRPADRKDKAKAKKGLFTIWKDVNDDALKGTPMLASVFDMAVDATSASKVTMGKPVAVNGHQTYELDFANGNMLWIDQQSYDILKWIQPEPGNAQKNERTFYNISINTNPKMTL
jgi:outer membrane lipoprotein-sorting protein